jgi:hypothetical protein
MTIAVANSHNATIKAPPHATDRSALRLSGSLSVLCDDLCWHQSHCEHDRQWQQDYIIEVAEDRDEVGDQVNRR